MTKNEFIGKVSNWDNHRDMLFQALEATTGTIIELGMGNGSTQQLHDYCKDKNRQLFSYEYDFEWFKKFKNLKSDIHDLIWIENWDAVNEHHFQCDVLFVDHSPGERRKTDIALFANKAKIIIAHDTEPSADHGYQMSTCWPLFKYKIDYVSNGAWTTAVSNYIDVNEIFVIAPEPRQGV